MGEGYYPALRAAVDTNVEVITDLLVKFGRLKRDSLLRACEERGFGDIAVFDLAIETLKDDGTVLEADNGESFLLVMM